MLAVKRPEVEHLGVLNRLRPSQQARRVVLWHDMLRDREVGVIPRDGHNLARGPTVKPGDLGEFLRGFGGGIAVNFDVHA